MSIVIPTRKLWKETGDWKRHSKKAEEKSVKNSTVGTVGISTIAIVDKTWWQEMCEPQPAMPSDIIMWVGVFFFSIAVACGAVDNSNGVNTPNQEASYNTTMYVR